MTSFPLGAVIQPKGICLPFAGQALQVSAEAFTSDPCSLPRRQAVVPAARSLLAAVTRLLVLADMVDVAYLLQHLTAVSNAPLTSGSCWPLVVCSGLFQHGKLLLCLSLAGLMHLTPGQLGQV